MPPARRGRQRQIDYWPGFVDALSTMLLAIIFLLSVFMLAQFFLAREVTGKDTALTKLNRQVEELTSLLALERAGKQTAEGSLASLNATLSAATKEKDLSARAASQIDILNQQIAALRRQLAAIEDALAASETQDKQSQARIADLGSRLNVALAQRVQELNRYRSDFFGRLRQILGDRPGVRIVGDRFVFQSEVLFDSGQAQVNAAGDGELDQLAGALIQLAREIPPDINWVMRVDGHTDSKRIRSALYKSNWELSSARAIAVVEYLVSKGVDPHRLVAAGFGEFSPIDTGTSDEDLRKNRRIELKLTEK